MHESCEVIATNVYANNVCVVDCLLINTSCICNYFIKVSFVLDIVTVIGFCICKTKLVYAISVVKLGEHVLSAVVIPLNCILSAVVEKIVDVIRTKAGGSKLNKSPAVVLCNLVRICIRGVYKETEVIIEVSSVAVPLFITRKAVAIGHRVAERYVDLLVGVLLMSVLRNLCSSADCSCAYAEQDSKNHHERNEFETNLS